MISQIKTKDELLQRQAEVRENYVGDSGAIPGENST